MKISIIVAANKERVIGKAGGIPWHLPSDLARFKQITIGRTVIMGRKTHESIIRQRGGNLPGRRIIVLTTQAGYDTAGGEKAGSLEQALLLGGEDAEVFVAGGEEVYRQALSLAQRLYITRVNLSVWRGDAFFPEYDPKEWLCLHSRQGVQEAGDEISYDFSVFERKEKAEKPPEVDISHARTAEQLELMERIAQDDVCPFCEPHLAEYHKEPILASNKHWLATRNQTPYEGSRVHLLLICRRHITFPSQMTDEEVLSLHHLITHMQLSQGFEGGSLLMRFGSTALTGASVRHLHLHLVRGGERGDGSMPLKAKIGYQA